MLTDFNTTWQNYRQSLEKALDQRLPPADQPPQDLHQAMRYICLNGGKRLRGMLVYAAGEMLGATQKVLDPIASAVEMIHAFSLAHDDLPAMDDDDMRRGRPSCHKAFDEATAILAGDAVHTLAFEILANDRALDIPMARRLTMISVLSKATGSLGMAGGQSLDMGATEQQISHQELSQIHRMKTAKLIQACCQLGGLAAKSATEKQLKLLDDYGNKLGLAFQIVDDILDVTSDSTTLGKQAGADTRLQKSTYVSLLGLEGARQACNDLYQQALESARLLGDNARMFQQLAHFVVNRSF